MSATHIVILLITGGAAGFAGGLLGLGGAFLMGPVQILVYENMGIATDMATKMAFGTNLFVVLLTAISGAFRHHKRRVVYWRVAIIMGCFSLLASFGGATLATHLPGEYLKIAFGAIILISAIRMLTIRLPEFEEVPREKPWLLALWALPIGLVSGIVGVGGGIVAIPIMTIALRFRMHNAVATSLAMMILTSAGGSIGYIINGIGVENLPAFSIGGFNLQIGYVNLQSWFLLAIASVSMAQVGAITAHRLPAKQIRYIFIAIMFYMALKMLGVFEWLGWPL
jgi:uncharacterized membrane protein YfcA